MLTEVSGVGYSPTDFTEFTEVSGVGYSPTEFTEFTEVSSVGYSPTDFTEFTEVSGRGFSPTDFTDFHRWLGCVIGSVGMAGCHTLLICAHPCLSVGGFLCQNVLCVPRVLWEHSICLLCWCCRGSCTSVVVFSHGIHGFPQMVRLRYWRRGYGRDAIPS